MNPGRSERIRCPFAGLLAGPPPTLLTASTTLANVTSSADPGTLNGNAAPTTDLSGNDTGFTATRNETVTADGTIEGGSTQLFMPGKMFLLEQ
jgi:hypothetical protein